MGKYIMSPSPKTMNATQKGFFKVVKTKQVRKLANSVERLFDHLKEKYPDIDTPDLNSSHYI